VLTATSTNIYISISLVESPVSNTAVCLEAAYMAPASLKCDFGVISNLAYARWGLFETGSSCAAGHTYKTSSCSASNVSAVIAELCIGKVSCSFTPSDGLFSFVEIFKNVGNTSWIAPAGVTSVDVLVVAGGGSGGGSVGGGGGGGGVTYVSGLSINPGRNYTVTVGAGGARASRQTGGNSGGASALEALRAMAAAVAVVRKKVLVDSMARTEVVAAVVQVGVIGLTLLERELQPRKWRGTW